MKLFDSVTFFDEEVILNLRLNILDPIVDKFIITEGQFDHRGRERNLVFDIEKYKKFKDKIIYLPVKEFPNKDNPWEMLKFQRNYPQAILNEISRDEDFIMASDIDEIPNPKNIKKFYHSKKKIGVFKQMLFYYKLNNLNITSSYWFGTKIAKKKNIISLHKLHGRKIKFYPWWRFDKPQNPFLIEDGGWHFSFIYNAEGIKKKINSYQHKEFDIEEYNSIENINRRIQNGEDIFGRSFKFKKIDMDKRFPEYLLNNLEEYSEWIIN